MKLNKEKFMKTEMGGELEETIRTWDKAIDERRKATPGIGNPDQGLGFKYWDNTCRSCQDRWEVFKLAIKQFYGIELFFTRTDEYFGVCSEDESIWLMKEGREENEFQFNELIRTPMRSIDEFLEKNEEVPEVYDVTQPSVREVIGVTGSVRRATVIEDYAFTITTRQDRTPAQVIDCGNGRYRYLTELECWRLQGYTDEDFERAKKAQQKKGRYYTALYKQAGNSIAVPIFESIFRKIILNEVREKEEQR